MTPSERSRQRALERHARERHEERMKNLPKGTIPKNAQEEIAKLPIEKMDPVPAGSPRDWSYFRGIPTKGRKRPLTDRRVDY